MAEQNNNIQYLNYGDNQRVALSDFMEKAANEVNNYVNSRPWSNKKKLKFMEAYSNIMSYGVSGASVKNGQWVVDINTNFDINTLPEADLKMYKEAAYFIQLQMSGMASDVELKKEGTKPFDNTTFVEGLHKHIKNNMFGGMDWNIGGPNDDWNKLDPRDNKGVRGRKKRAETLANYLSSYADTIDENTYSFEDSPFKDYKDFKARIQNAITALRTDTIDDDESALNQLGLRASNYFNNGTGDPFEQGDYSGTYGDYYNRYLPEQLKKKLELEGQKEKALQKALELKKQAVGLNYTMTTRVGPGALPTTRLLADKYGSTEGLLNQITEYGNRGLDKLTPEETKELVAAFRYGATASLTDDEFNLLKTSPSYKGASKSRFRKFPNISNLFLDTATGQVINIYDLATKDARGSDFLAGLSSADLQLLEQQRRIFGGEGLTGADIADISAALVDAVGVGATFVPVVGNVLGAGTGLAGSLTHFGADVARDGLDWGDAGRLALNAGFDLATLIPGLGTAAKAGKLAKAIGKWVPGIIASIGAIQGLSNGKEIINSFGKLAHPSTVTVEDLQNMSQGIALLAGGVNVGRGYKQNKKFKNGVGAQEATVTTQKGQKVKLNEQEYNTINSKNATREAKQQALESAVQRHNTNNPSQKIDLTNDGLVYKGRSVTHPLRTTEKSTDVDLLTAPIQGRASGVDFAKLRREDIRDLAQHRWKTRVLPGKTLEQKLNWTNNGMFMRGYHFNNSSAENPAISSSSSPTSTTPTSTTPPSSRTREVFDDFSASGKAPAAPKHNMTRSEWRKANKKLYNDINKKGRFTNNMPEEGVYEFKDPTGNTHTFRLIQRDDDFLLDIKSSNGTNRLAVLSLDLVKKGIWDNIKQSLNSTGLRHDISLPANIIRALQGTAYGWLKHGGRIDRLKMQQYKEFMKR